MTKTKTRGAIAAVVVALGISGFIGAGVGDAKPKPKDPSGAPQPKAPNFKPDKDAKPDEFGVIRVDFEEMGRSLGLQGEALRGFVDRSQKVRELKDAEDRAKREKGETPNADVGTPAARP